MFYVSQVLWIQPPTLSKNKVALCYKLKYDNESTRVKRMQVYRHEIRFISPWKRWILSKDFNSD